MQGFVLVATAALPSPIHAEAMAYWLTSQLISFLGMPPTAVEFPSRSQLLDKLS